MEYLGKLVPIGVLLILAKVLLFLLWRAMRERAKEGQVFALPEITVTDEAAPRPAPVEPAPPPLSAAPVETPAPRRKRAAPVPAKTPIEGVVGLLRDKDALAKAFLLREILGPPVSAKR